VWHLALGHLEPADQFDLFPEGRSAGRFKSTSSWAKTVAYGATERTPPDTLGRVGD